jgi:mitotic-spindle organizing protein 1
MVDVAQKVIQQLREEYPTSSVDGDADDAGAGAR